MDEQDYALQDALVQIEASAALWDALLYVAYLMQEQQ